MRIIKTAAQRYCMPIALVFSAIAINAGASETEADISVSETEITVVAKQAKLSEILIELANQADITVIDAETISGTFDGEVTGTTIESVLNQLGVNSIFVWNNSDDIQTLREIIVLSAAEEDSQFLPSGDAGDAVVSTGNQSVDEQLPSTDADQASQASVDATETSETIPAGNGNAE